MRIAALRLHNVKRFAGRGVAIEGIGDGVNVLCAANEFGKSTSFEALHALFFQSHAGAPKEVRRLQPYAGGNPLVEADIVTDAGRFRLAKRFLGGRMASVTDLNSGRLVAQADAAEAFIAGLVRGGTAGPAGLLWVRQGITGLEARDRRDEEDERQVRATLLASVQGEVEAVTGGRRMNAITEMCAQALQVLVTPTGRPKAGGAYDAAVAEQARLVAEETRLRTDVDALRAALDQRAQAQRTLAELEQPEQREERRAAVAKAQAALDAAKAHAAQLATAQAEADLARERHGVAKKLLSAFRDGLAQAERLRGERQAAEHRRDEVADRRKAAIDALERAGAAVHAAEEQEQGARRLLERLDAALKAREAAGQLAGLEQRLAEAEALRTEMETAEAALALPAAGAIDSLRKLDAEIARLRAVEEASLPTLSVAYLPGAAVRVSLDGAPLDDGEQRSFGIGARIDMPGIGTLSLHANRPPPSGRTLADAERDSRDLLAKLGARDFADALRLQAEADARKADLMGLRARFEAKTPEGLPALRADVARRRSAPPVDLELKGDPEAVRGDLTAAAARLGDARNAVRELQPDRERADKAFVDGETALARAKSGLEQADALVGPEPERPGRLAALVAKESELATLAAQADGLATALHTAAPDLESAEAALRRARSAGEGAADRISRLNAEIAGLNGEIRTRSDEAVEEAWHEAADALAAASARVKGFAHEVAVLSRVQAALEAARTAARDLYLGPVMAELKPLLGLLFDDVSIVFDEKTLLPSRISRAGQDEDIDRLSGGMREQLSVLTRLAFARLLARDGHPAPVILDDALVYSDDDRIERMFDALHRQSRDLQIIVFSCRQRAFQKLGGTELKMQPWRPADA